MWPMGYPVMAYFQILSTSSKASIQSVVIQSVLIYINGEYLNFSPGNDV